MEELKFAPDTSNSLYHLLSRVEHVYNMSPTSLASKTPKADSLDFRPPQAKSSSPPADFNILDRDEAFFLCMNAAGSRVQVIGPLGATPELAPPVLFSSARLALFEQVMA